MIPQENPNREFPFTDEDFQYIVEIVNKTTGIALAPHKKNMVYGRIVKRLRALNLNSFEQYCGLISSNDGDSEIVNFVNAITTNVTHFFRENHHFEHLRDDVFSKMVKNPPLNKRVRIWSAGCSAGMEAYSIAMTAHNAIEDIDKWDFKILASDLDTTVLERGNKGIYRKQDVEKVPANYRKKYIKESKSSDEIEVSEELKNLVFFKHLNLLHEWPVKGPFDAIFCRNVVIYFKPQTQVVLFNKFAEKLGNDGWLYIGHSENLHGISDRFKLHGKTIYKKVQ